MRLNSFHADSPNDSRESEQFVARLTGEGVTPRTAWMYENLYSHWTSQKWSQRRVRMIRSRFGAFGAKSSISFDVRMLDVHRIHIGTNVSINNKCVLDGRGSLEIGDDSLIGFESIIITSTHAFGDLDVPVRQQGMEGGAVTIGHDVWLGCRVIVLPGVTIGDQAIVAAGSVVRDNVAPRQVVGGVPARKIGERGTGR